MLLGLGLLACSDVDTGLVEAAPGEPLPGLSPEELASFEAGRLWFERPFTPDEGLGPLFNQTRCSSCHDLPTTGGHGAEPVVKVSGHDGAGGCSLLEEHGGDLLQASVVEALREAGFSPERVPAEADAMTELRAPPLYGLGLVAAVPDREIRRRADPNDRDGDGISGRVGSGDGQRPGRFGAKGQHATLEAFIESAANGELGLTTPRQPTEQPLNGVPVPAELDPAPEPELDDEALALLTAYVRFLASPGGAGDGPREPAGDGGLRLFEEVGCADCHVPTLRTGPSEVAALDRRSFRIYSDLLLHDMGPGLEGICTPGASNREYRTEPLMGLRYRNVFLHDGRARRLMDAILAHGGEAEAARAAFAALNRLQQEELLRFLRTL